MGYPVAERAVSKRTFTSLAASVALVLALILAPILGMGATAASAQTPCNHKVTELIAGKDTDVGNVNVCNDSTTLTVTYEATTPWCLTETHLQAGSSLDDFPLTKKGNPKTDEFAYGDTYPAWNSEPPGPLRISGGSLGR